MKVMDVRNVTRQSELGRKIRMATSLPDRAVGLLSTRSLLDGEGMYLTPCRSIHTLFMKYAIDVLFLDADGVVVHAQTYKPWRMSCVYWKSRGALELSAGAIGRSGTQTGDRIEMRELNG